MKGDERAYHRYEDFPSIGIARLRNSPERVFIGRENPGVRPVPTGGIQFGLPDERQAARFRMFGYNGSNLVQEITG